MKYYALEGIDCAGKSSVMKILEKKLADFFWDFPRQPGGSPLAEKIRQLIKESNEEIKYNVLVKQLLMSASNVDCLLHCVAKPPNSKYNVLSDRCAISGLIYFNTECNQSSAYAVDYFLSLNLAYIHQAIINLLNVILKSSKLSKVFYFKINIETFLRRYKKKIVDHQFFLDLIDNYNHFFENECKKKYGIDCVTIDATLTSNEIADIIYEEIKKDACV